MLKSGTSLCNGDSGGEMVFLMGDAWYLRSVVNTAVSRKDANLYRTSHFVVFVDAAKYLQWIPRSPLHWGCLWLENGEYT